jgi:phosphatidylserine decarboxylase
VKPGVLRSIATHEALNFALTNRIPRVALTRLMGWYSGLRSPWLTRLSVAVWRRFTDLDLSEAADNGRFESLQQVFTRRLVPGARPVDPRPEILASPCDAIVGACGRIEHGQLLQAKGSVYRLHELLCSPGLAAALEGGVYVTLRLTSAMYHRFHAPHDLELEHVSYVPGDAYNVNPPALARIAGLYCRNERAVLRTRLAANGALMVLVPVAAILVASIRLQALDVPSRLRRRSGTEWPCEHSARKGDELGWFEHGSTIIMLAAPGHELVAGIEAGRTMRAGEPLMCFAPPK